VSLEAERLVTEQPEMPIRTGTDAEENPITTTARQYLEDARASAKAAKADISLFEAAARCLLGMA